MGFLIWEASVATLGALGMTGYMLYRLVTKRGFLPPPGKGGYPEVREWRDKHRKSINVIIAIVMTALIIPGNVIIAVPFLRDFKYVVSRDYPQFEGEIVSEVRTVKGRVKRQKIVLQLGEDTLEVSVDVEDKNKGDHIRIMYLPHLNMGAIY